MAKCETRTGFVCELPENVMDNMELLDVMADDSIAVGFRASTAVKLILGAEQRKKLYDHLRTSDGRVPVAAVEEAVEDIIKSFGENGKNS
ncbi:MAG: hypothetical protein IKT52_13740 [Oscillospiraceae bacterium]|nr:hypothetical protein [Oscillospiraceae bacterium]